MLDIEDQQFFCNNHLGQNVKRHSNTRAKAIKKVIERLRAEPDAEVNQLIAKIIEVEENENDELANEEDDSTDALEHQLDAKLAELRQILTFKRNFRETIAKLTDGKSFDSTVKNLQANWHPREIAYFNSHLRADLLQNLRSQTNFPIYDLTTNCSESLNAVLPKHLGTKARSISELLIELNDFCLDTIETFNGGYRGRLITNLRILSV